MLRQLSHAGMELCVGLLLFLSFVLMAFLL